jgi:hypothetical protein
MRLLAAQIISESACALGVVRTSVEPSPEVCPMGSSRRKVVVEGRKRRRGEAGVRRRTCWSVKLVTPEGQQGHPSETD